MEFFASFIKQTIGNKSYQKNAVFYYHQALNHLAQFKHRFIKSIARCDLCNTLSDGKLLCTTCLHDTPHFILPKGTRHLLLWPAIDKVFNNRKFDQLLCYAPYLWPYDTWLKQLKYQGRFELAPLFAELLTLCWYQHLKQVQTDDYCDDICVTCVPIHMNKWLKRGFNQAHLIAKRFAQMNHLTYQANMLSRVTEGNSQVGQSGAQRRKNLSNAFAVNPQYIPTYKHVVLIDDVITTGTTANVISRILKKKGVEKVTILTVAISLPKDK
ncbi:ComF family protein [Thalassotalea piscium]